MKPALESDMRDERDRLAAAVRQIAEACHWSHDPSGDPEALIAYIGQLQRSADDALDTAAAVERVRALHSPGIVFLHADECGHGDGDGHTVIEGLDGDLLCFDSPTDDRFCVECASAWDEPPAWPCPTLRALDGTEDGPAT